jgi:SynChlorMet cassette protein ScmD
MANPFVVLREGFDDWAILFHPDIGHGFGLNPAGVHLWKLLDGWHTLDALLEEIRHCTERVPEDVRDHVVAFVDDLVAEGLAGFAISERGLPDHPNEAALHPEKYSSSAKCSYRKRVAKNKRLCGVNKKVTYQKPQLVDLLADRIRMVPPQLSGSSVDGRKTTMKQNP